MTALPLPIPEWRALLSDGPAVVMMAKADAVALLDRLVWHEGREESLQDKLAESQQAEAAWCRSSMAQERRAIRAEREIQALRAAILAVLQPDGMQGRGA